MIEDRGGVAAAGSATAAAAAARELPCLAARDHQVIEIERPAFLEGWPSFVEEAWTLARLARALDTPRVARWR